MTTSRVLLRSLAGKAAVTIVTILALALSGAGWAEEADLGGIELFGIEGQGAPAASGPAMPAGAGSQGAEQLAFLPATDAPRSDDLPPEGAERNFIPLPEGMEIGSDGTAPDGTEFISTTVTSGDTERPFTPHLDRQTDGRTAVITISGRYGAEVTQRQADALIDSMRFPRGAVTQVAGPAQTYNCWGWTFTLAERWLYSPDHVQKIVEENGYAEVAARDVRVGDLVVYRASGTVTHTGAVQAVSGTDVTVRSKWGALPLYDHRPACVPPSYGTFTYYRTARRTPGTGTGNNVAHTLNSR